MQNFIERFLQTSALYPEKTALVCNEEKMTYAQLEQLSAKIASRLLRSGARKEKIYPIVLERSMEYIASIIGILRAGAAYSPLSTEYPKDRVAFIIKDSGADFAIDDSFLENIEDEKILSEFPEIHMEDAAIAIYTSGSTGNPKGIIHDHWSFTNAIVRQLEVGATADDIEMSVTPFNFAISSHDILTSLWAGAEIHILTEEQRKDILFIDSYIDKHGITASVISPQMLKQLPVRESTLKLINSGGATQTDDITMLAVVFNGMRLYREITVEAKVERLSEVNAFLEEQLDASEFDMRSATQICVIADDVCSNIVYYAYPDKDNGMMKVAFSFDPKTDEAEITFTDSGIPFNPLNVPEPDISKIEEGEEGGLGIMLVRKFSDKLLYEYSNGQNILKIIKKRNRNKTE